MIIIESIKGYVKVDIIGQKGKEILNVTKYSENS